MLFQIYISSFIISHLEEIYLFNKICLWTKILLVIYLIQVIGYVKIQDQN